jgi:hypothetical protein
MRHKLWLPVLLFFLLLSFSELSHADGPGGAGQGSATMTVDANPVDAARFIRDSLLHDSHGAAMTFQWPHGSDDIADVRITQTAMTIVVANGRNFDFTLKDLKFTYDQDFLGNKALLITGTDDSISFGHSYGRDAIDRVTADFGVLGRAAESGVAAAPAQAGSFTTKRLAVRIVAHCPEDPDSFSGDDYYSKCEQDEMDKLRGWISSALQAKHVFAAIGDDKPDMVLTVTLTKDMDDRSDANDFSAGVLKFEADIQLADSAGNILQKATVTDQGRDDAEGDAVEREFAGKIADAGAAGNPPAQ